MPLVLRQEQATNQEAAKYKEEINAEPPDRKP
jgi:hypothetical protein